MLHLFEFSRQYCVTICGFLIPTNLLFTSITLLLLVRQFSTVNLRWNATFGLVAACLMFFHVLTWLMVGVVMTPTYILLSLGFTCFSINCYAFFAPIQFRKILGIA